MTEVKQRYACERKQAPCNSAHTHADPSTDGEAVCAFCGWTFEAHDNYRRYHRIGEYTPVFVPTDPQTLLRFASLAPPDAPVAAFVLTPDHRPPVLFPPVEPVGRKDDSGKLDYTLLPIKALDEVVKVLEFGEKKYGRDNWRSVPNAEPRYLGAALRHVFAMVKGEVFDTESGLPHAAHAVCCLLFWMEV
jgi:hypothetical protein